MRYLGMLFMATVFNLLFVTKTLACGHSNECYRSVFSCDCLKLFDTLRLLRDIKDLSPTNNKAKPV